MRSEHLQAIKTFEGFTARAKWDYAQSTNGFGTRALRPDEVIDEAEANRRFAAEIEKARQFVERHAAGWDEGTKAALTSLTFNAGTRWQTSGLGEAVRAFDVDAVRDRFVAYTKAGGAELPGLVRRRLAEAEWIGRPATVATQAACAGVGPGQAAQAPALPLATAIETIAQTLPSGARPHLHTIDPGRAPIDHAGDRAPPPMTAAGPSASAAKALLLLTLESNARDHRLALASDESDAPDEIRRA
jgi:lysozyme